MLELTMFNAIKRFTFNDVNDHSRISGWVNHPTRGWYNDSNQARAVDNILPHGEDSFAMTLPFHVKRITRVSGIFTTYYNTPAGGLGVNLINCKLRNLVTGEDAGWIGIGYRDAWTDHTNGMLFVNGSSSTKIVANRLNIPLALNIPSGYEVTRLDLDSTWYVASNRNYPASLRGIKDIEIQYL